MDATLAFIWRQLRWGDNHSHVDVLAEDSRRRAARGLAGTAVASVTVTGEAGTSTSCG